MKAILVTEGRGDLAVISNVLKGSLDIDLSDIKFHAPEYEYDQTDLYQMDVAEYGGWNGVKKTCLNHEDVEFFLEMYEESILIIQIDSAERNEIGFDVCNPPKSNDENYCDLVFENVNIKIKEWLNNKFSERTAYAICVEEIEAWLLTLFFDNTSRFPNPKEKFEFEFNRKLPKKDKKILSDNNVFNKYYKLSKPFSKKKDLPKFVINNLSFHKFYDQLMALNI